MSPRTKGHIAAGLVLALGLWPIAHRVLVTRYDVSPWKLFGFAMYTSTHTVVVELVDETAAPQVLSPRSLTSPVAAALADFEDKRTALGQLHSPDELARTVIEAFPHIERLAIVVHVDQLDGRTSRLERRTLRYAYP